KDKKWLVKYEAKLAAQAAAANGGEPVQTSEAEEAAQAPAAEAARELEGASELDGTNAPAGDAASNEAELRADADEGADADVQAELNDDGAELESDDDELPEEPQSVAADLAELAAESLENISSETATDVPGNDAGAHDETFAAGAIGDSDADEAPAETIVAQDAGKLSEILEGLKNKNAGVKDTNPSEREHLKQSVYRPDQLAQALRDFDGDETGSDDDNQS
ncbi:MAG TPA: hypothetical protein VFV50_08660, partial [Bdellovibrionales bacterium]|nr:hypothetical protein [Bdellovibrionales bacterium]